MFISVFYKHIRKRTKSGSDTPTVNTSNVSKEVFLTLLFKLDVDGLVGSDVVVICSGLGDSQNGRLFYESLPVLLPYTHCYKFLVYSITPPSVIYSGNLFQRYGPEFYEILFLYVSPK